MSKLLLALLAFSFVFTGCGKSTFEKEMRSGKDAFHSGDYESAIKHFDTALIEEPSNEDAKILFEKAQSELLKKKTQAVLEEYQKENSSILFAYREVWVRRGTAERKELPGIQDIRDQEIINSLSKQAYALGEKYIDYPDIYEAHQDFVSSLQSYASMFEELRNNGSQFRISQYSSLHEDFFNRYERKIAKLKGIER